MGTDMVERLQEREDCLARLCQDYLLTFLKIQRLTESLTYAIRGTLVKKKVANTRITISMTGRNRWSVSIFGKMVYDFIKQIYL